MLFVIWPSAAKIARLRGTGVVPLSLLSLRLTVLLGTAIVLYINVPVIFAGISYEKIFAALEAGTEQSLISGVVNEFASFCILLTLILFFILTIAGLLQTRFLFNLGLCAMRLERLWQFPRGTKTMATILKLLILTPVLLLVTGFVFWWGAPMLAGGLTVSARTLFSTKGYSIPGAIIPMGLTGLAILLAVAWYRVYFLWKHRMHREELERELRER